MKKILSFATTCVFVLAMFSMLAPQVSAGVSTVLSGYDVLVTGEPGLMQSTATRIGDLGASVYTADPSTLTSSMLAEYCVVWISMGGADNVDDAGKAGIVKSYVYNGGGLILEQPNEVMTPQCLPYAFPIVDIWYYNECTGTVLDPNHYLTQGLTIEANEIPPTYDEVGTIGSEWTVLAIDDDGDPKLSVARYGAGRIIVELGNTGTGSCVCGECMKDVMIERMIKWACIHAIPVHVDIKPGSWPNPVNTRSKGVLPVAVCGTEDFDVMTIDPVTVRLHSEDVREGVAPLRWSWDDVATPYTADMGGGHALDGDGYLDLVLHFDTPEVASVLTLTDNLGETLPLILRGNLFEEYDGTPIEGQDNIRILG